MVPWGKGTEIEFYDGRSFYFLNLSSFLSYSFGGDLVEGRFKMELRCGFDKVRMCLFRCSTFCVLEIRQFFMLSLL